MTPLLRFFGLTHRMRRSGLILFSFLASSLAALPLAAETMDFDGPVVSQNLLKITTNGTANGVVADSSFPGCSTNPSFYDNTVTISGGLARNGAPVWAARWIMNSTAKSAPPSVARSARI